VHDIEWPALEVALVVRVPEPGQYLPDQQEGVLERQSLLSEGHHPPEQASQVEPFDVLHGDVVGPVDLARIEDLHDVGCESVAASRASSSKREMNAGSS